MAIQADENILSIGAADPRTGLNQHFIRGVSPAMRALERTITDIAPTDIPILLVGRAVPARKSLPLKSIVSPRAGMKLS